MHQPTIEAGRSSGAEKLHPHTQTLLAVMEASRGNDQRPSLSPRVLLVEETKTGRTVIRTIKVKKPSPPSKEAQKVLPPANLRNTPTRSQPNELDHSHFCPCCDDVWSNHGNCETPCYRAYNTPCSKCEEHYYRGALCTHSWLY